MSCNDVPLKLWVPFVLRTSNMSAMHHDITVDLEIPNTSLIIVELCHIIATRGTRLGASGIFGILKRMGRYISREGGPEEKTVIAMDGGLYEYYYEYNRSLQNSLYYLLGEEVATCAVFKHSIDISGIGVALLAVPGSLYVDQEHNAYNSKT